LQRASKPGKVADFNDVAKQIHEFGTQNGFRNEEYRQFLYKFKFIAHDSLDERSIKR
jgi:hypothetical protein